MAIKLRNLTVNRVDLVDQGANPGAHITLFKGRTSVDLIRPDTTANAVSVATFAKAIAAHPGIPTDEAVDRYFADHPEAYAHYRQNTGAGTVKPFTAVPARTAPVVKRADATTTLTKMATVLAGTGAVSHAEAFALAAHVAPDIYAVHAGHPIISKAGRPSEADLEQRIVEYFRTTRDALRRGADQKAAEATAMQMRAAFTELLNLWLVE